MLREVEELSGKTLLEDGSFGRAPRTSEPARIFTYRSSRGGGLQMTVPAS